MTGGQLAVVLAEAGIEVEDRATLAFGEGEEDLALLLQQIAYGYHFAASLLNTLYGAVEIPDEGGE